MTAIFSMGEGSQALRDLEAMQSHLLSADFDGRIYPPPVDWAYLVKAMHGHFHHERALTFKADALLLGARPAKSRDSLDYFTKFIPYEDLQAAFIDFVTLGNAFLAKLKNIAGRVIGLRHLPALVMRRMKEPRGFARLDKGQIAQKYGIDEVIQIKRYDPGNTVYGVPTYLSGLYAAQASMTLHKALIKYGEQGHMGLLLAMSHLFPESLTDYEEEGKEGTEKKEETEEERIIRVLRKTAGEGQGKTTVVNLPSQDDREGNINNKLAVHELGKDFRRLSFKDIVESTAQAVLTVHGIPPEMASAVFENRWGGKLSDVADVFNKGTIAPIHRLFYMLINRHLAKDDWIDFDPYSLPLAGTADNT